MLSGAEIVALTEKLSYESCHSGVLSGYPQVGCEFHAFFKENKWSVGVRSIFRKADGRRLEVMGAESLYVFSSSGKLLYTLPGM